MRLLRKLSLFSGIGGFDLAAERAGITTTAFCERDTNCRAVLEAHWPGVPIYDDVRHVTVDTLRARGITEIDVITGGFPCQDLSLAGRRAGLAGERSGLWHEFHRIIREVRPAWVVIENVPGLLSSHKGRDFATLLSGLVKCGYGVCWRILDAQFTGVAQRRRRVWIVGSLGSGRSAEILFEREGVRWHPPQGDSQRSENPIAFTERTRSAGRNLEWQDDCSYTLTNPGAGGRAQDRLVAAPLVARQGKGGFGDPGNDNLVAATLGQRMRGTDDSCANNLQIVYGLSNQPTPKFAENLSPSLDAKTSGGGRVEAIATDMAVRRLMPIECERLMGFPEGWTDVPVGKRPMSDSARYRMLGNALVPACCEFIFRGIASALQEGAER